MKFPASADTEFQRMCFHPLLPGSPVAGGEAFAVTSSLASERRFVAYSPSGGVVMAAVEGRGAWAFQAAHN